MKAQSLRKKYPKFVYQGYSYRISNTPRTRTNSVRGKNLEILFDFRTEPNINFKPKVVIKNVDKSKIERVGERALNNLVFNLGLMEIPSYWKATCSPEIIIKAGHLNSEQIKWWKDIFLQGMGQFFYENKINFKKSNFLTIKSTELGAEKIRANSAMAELARKDKILVAVGGGKDSAVTLEILKKAKKKINCFSLNPTEAANKIMKIAGCREPIIARRKIDGELLKLNRRGFLNGHTPFSAYLAFLSILVATIFENKYVVFSNERSSNEGNVDYLGKVINHQWSKSFDFEKKFRKYAKKYLSKDAEYFSFLRPLYEIQIVRLFSKYPKYFPAFLSCNEAHKTASGTKKPTKKWCGQCSKCLFVFICLYPFIKERKLLKIFGKNLFENKKLIPVMQELIGEKRFKPFECVGTKKESLAAFYLSWEKNKERPSAKFLYLLRYFEEKILPKYPNLKKGTKKILSSWNKQHNLPKEFKVIF